MSLIETIITIVIFILVMIGLFGVISSLYTVYYYSFEQAQAVSEAVSGVETMTREIREAVLGDDGTYIIERANDFEFIFYSDIDRDSNVERVRYYLDGTKFMKGVIKPQGNPLRYITSQADPNFHETTVALSMYVRNAPPVFRYFGGDLFELPAPARLMDTKLMRLNLVINVKPNRPPNDFSLQSEVQLRNLKTNL